MARWQRRFVDSSRGLVLALVAFWVSACAGGGGSGAGVTQADTSPSFSIAVTPASVSLAPGESVQLLFLLTPQNGFTGNVDVTLGKAPEGWSMTGLSLEVPKAISVTHNIEISAAANAPLGIVPITVRAQSGSMHAQTTLQMEVIAPPPPPTPSFSLAVAPVAASLTQGSSLPVLVSLMSLHGFQGNVNISLDSPPQGVSVDTLPMSVFLDAPVAPVLTLAIAPNAALGTQTLTFRASAGAQNKTAPLHLTVLDGNPGMPQLNLSFGIKTIKFSWEPVVNAALYRLFEKPAGSAGSIQIGADLSASFINFDWVVPLYEHAGSSFHLEACNNLSCVDSNKVALGANLHAAIGYFKASDTAAADHFGQSLALSGDGNTLAIGAPDEDDLGTNSGAVYIFARSGSSWAQQTKLKASNAAQDDRFGLAVSLNSEGNTLVVGAPGEDGTANSAVYVFIRNSGVWSQQAYLQASNAGTGDNFGASVSLSADGNLLAVGAELEDSISSNSGAAYLFTRSGASWTQQAYLKASNPDAGDRFGSSLSLAADGNTLAVGADEENGGATGINGNQADNSAANGGAVYIFSRNGATWTQQAYVKASDTQAGDYFGTCVSLACDGNTLAVGARGEDDLAAESGAVYLFTRADSSWSQLDRFKADNAEGDDAFGFSLSLAADGNTLAVGAYQEDSVANGIDADANDNNAADSGAVYVFTKSSGSWAETAYVKAPNTGAGDRFGISLSLNANGNTLAVGADYEDSQATGIGGDANNNSAQNAGAVSLY